MEHIKTPKVDNVVLAEVASNSNNVKGTLHLTTTHIIFIDPKGVKETWILYNHISDAEKLPLTARGSALRIRTKTFRNIVFIITRDRECTDVLETITKLSNPVDLKELYAFHYNPKQDELNQDSCWDLYDAVNEYKRMEVSSLWIRSTLNENYKLCETYPRILYFPASVSGVIVKECAQFRSKNRLPALSYYCKETQAALCRCAQPLSGLSNRSNEDEAMLQAIIKSTPGTDRLYIVDTRPKINAMANRAAGKGYENVAHYENIDFHFIGIENIHVMRQSLQKMIEIFDAKDLSMSSYLRGLDECGWLKHIKSVMDTSLFIAKAIHTEKRSVLVHCSDGWDRTAQTCSLAEMVLDPYYRTIYGFQVLVEKEWLSFGHKFIHRCGLLTGDPKEASPIFTQFLEAVWQLSIQFPTAFQFNERFLLDLHEHLYSCQFGTFLGNCEKERKDRKLDKKTYSLWGYMWKNLTDYINPFYQEGSHGVLRPSSSPQQLRFWRSLYNRFCDDAHPRESVADYVCSLNDHTDSLKDHIRFLEKRIENLSTKQNIENENEIENQTKEGESSTVENDTDMPEPNSVPTEEGEDSSDKDIIDSSQKTEKNSEHLQNDSFVLNERYILDTEKQKENIGTTTEHSTTNEDCADLKVMPSFAVEWDSFRGVSQCTCGKPIHTLSRKYHCWNCGKVFCSRCVDQLSQLPGHHSGNKVPVCKTCHKVLRR